ncbi:MAG TPA: thioredoxin fold domain-containing protein [Ideonella sp.]|uniref:thioredoxin fold domain-containing protein n=1 Tax=Ideonella sp. TaxID=1929293 RepID=UPI002B6864CF|nr:thioredoxin fold domain-containing protein [Ideonella sp.]HSI47734.1 thioredoxin fold domain-containing protein [Ideonella sp.]
MNRRHFALKTSSMLLAAGLAACSEKPAQAAAPSATKLNPQQAYELSVKAQGFTVGPVMAANTVYVYFDTTCPHCGHLWEQSKPLHGKLKMVWIPVPYLRPQSLTQGATILAATDPVAAMELNETRLMARQGGIEVNPNAGDAVLAKLKANMALFDQMGVDSVPLIVFRNSKTGEYGSQTGALETAQLAGMVGL